MKPLSIAAFVALLLPATFVISSGQLMFAQSVIPPTNPALNLKTVSLNFTTAQIDPTENNQVVRAFVPTGSKSVNCLATLNETNNVQFGTVLFCGEREPSNFGNVPGVLVSVFFPQPVTPDFVMSVTLYQQDAKRYGAPVLCNGADGC